MKEKSEKCNLVKQGFKKGSCNTFFKPEKIYTSEYLRERACQITLKWEGKTPFRLIKSVLLSRPEEYLSIYQSGCNLSFSNAIPGNSVSIKMGDGCLLMKF